MLFSIKNDIDRFNGKQGRIQDRTVADDWAGAVMPKPLVMDGPTDGPRQRKKERKKEGKKERKIEGRKER